jgi:hypothetical protein
VRFLLACVVVTVVVPAAAKPRPPPPIPRKCPGPLSFSDMEDCVAKHGGMNMSHPTSTIAVIDDRVHAYLFVQGRDQQWRYATVLPDVHVELIGRHPVKLEGEIGEQIDLRHRIDVGPLDVVTEQMAVVCSGTWCTEVVYDCTRMSRGRATEVMHGHVTIERGVPRVVADRSQAGSLCNH